MTYIAGAIMTMNHGKTLVAGVFGIFGAIMLAAGPAAAGQCRDPWITQAVKEVTGRAPNGDYESGECTYTQYGGGHWNGYAQLKGFVQQRLGTQLSVRSTGKITIGTFQSLPKQNYNGQQFAYYNNQWMKIVASGGGNYTLISNDGASIVTNASGN